MTEAAAGTVTEPEIRQGTEREVRAARRIGKGKNNKGSEPDEGLGTLPQETCLKLLHR